MAEIIRTTFQLRRGYEAVWEKNNPILACGEPGFVIDKNKLKIGDGATAWNDLAYFGDGGLVEIEEITETVNNLTDNVNEIIALLGDSEKENTLIYRIESLDAAINNSQEIEIVEIESEETKKALSIKELNVNKLVQNENEFLVLYGGSASKNI